MACTCEHGNNISGSIKGGGGDILVSAVVNSENNTLLSVGACAVLQ